jgi:hypothetical protein
VTQPNDSQPSADLIARTLNSVRAASEDLAQLTEYKDGIAALVHTASGTALLHDLRREIDVVNKLLPFKS